MSGPAKYRKMSFAQPCTSDEWMSLARTLLFPTRVPDGNGGWRWKTFEYYCSSCDQSFQSDITPVTCPNCQAKAADDPQAVELTHKGYTAKTFPFYSPII